MNVHPSLIPDAFHPTNQFTSFFVAGNVQALPECWQHVNLSKAILPRLLALLRHGCYGSGAASYPALLPLVALLPREVAGAHPDALPSLLAALWGGLPAAGKAGRAAGAEAFRHVRIVCIVSSCIRFDLQILAHAVLARPAMHVAPAR